MGRIPPPYGTPSIPPPPRFPFSCRFILFSPLQIRRRGLNPRHGPSACCQTSLRCKTAPDAPLGLCILYDEATHTGQPWRGPRPSHGVVSAYGRWPGPRATSVWAQHPRSQTIRHRETPPRSARPRARFALNCDRPLLRSAVRPPTRPPHVAAPSRYRSPTTPDPSTPPSACSSSPPSCPRPLVATQRDLFIKQRLHSRKTLEGRRSAGRTVSLGLGRPRWAIQVGSYSRLLCRFGALLPIALCRFLSFSAPVLPHPFKSGHNLASPKSSHVQALLLRLDRSKPLTGQRCGISSTRHIKCELEQFTVSLGIIVLGNHKVSAVCTFLHDHRTLTQTQGLHRPIDPGRPSVELTTSARVHTCRRYMHTHCIVRT